MGGDYSQKHGIEFGVTLCADTRKKIHTIGFLVKANLFLCEWSMELIQELKNFFSVLHRYQHSNNRVSIVLKDNIFVRLSNIMSISCKSTV